MSKTYSKQSSDKNVSIKSCPKVSIIIPLYVKTLYFYETIEKCLELDYPNFEILIGVDQEMDFLFKDKRIRVLKTDELRTGPAEKRDIGVERSKGEILAFLDDDSYPEKNWLKKSLEIMEEEDVSCVCGPGVTPPADTLTQQITGAVISSKLGSGPYFYRFTKGSPRYVDDYPAYNLICKKNELKKVGGWGTKFYGGEDTALCLKLIKAGIKILYHPDIVVYHHRRSFPVGYMRQVGNVGKHRGYFVKKYPQTSMRISYFGPALFTIAVALFAILSLISFDIFFLSFAAFLFWYGFILIYEAKKNSLMINLTLPFAHVINYLTYGYNFIIGLIFTRELVR